jgi:hypothetical protein
MYKKFLCGNSILDLGEECDNGIGCCGCRCVKGYVPKYRISDDCDRNITCDCIPTTTCIKAGIECGPLYNGCEIINCGTWQPWNFM